MTAADAPKVTSVRPAGENWSTRLSDGRRLSLEVVGLQGRLRLSVSTQHAATPLQLYLDPEEARALAGAVRVLTYTDPKEVLADANT